MSDPNHDPVADLLRQAGRRATPAEASVERARVAAHGAWRDEIRRSRRQRIVRGTLGVAALTLLVLAVDRDDAPGPTPAIAAQVISASGTINIAGRSLGGGDSILLNAAVQTAGGPRATLRLADGVEMRLDADTEVAFPAPGAVSLTRGGAFFDSGARKGSEPIEVRTAIATVRDIGTRFEVRLIDNATRVRVRDGIVQVNSGGASEQGARGTELFAGSDGRIASRRIAIAGADWDWIALAAEPLSIEGKTLQEFLDWVSREGGWRITFASDAVAQSAATVILHGAAVHLTPEEALRVVLPTCGLTHRTEGDTIIVQSSDGAGDRP